MAFYQGLLICLQRELATLTLKQIKCMDFLIVCYCYSSIL